MKVDYNFSTGEIIGDNISVVIRTVGETLDIYLDSQVKEELKEHIAYYVQVHEPEPEVEGALQFGTSNINPGDVNGEYFMTKGHTHEINNRAEYYFGISGSGLLLLMNQDGETTIEEVTNNSLHYIKGDVAHRLVNVGTEKLVVGACWNADAGHNYNSIAQSGFKVRIMKSETEKGYVVVRT